MESFQPLIERVTRDNKLHYIMGNFNLDLLNSDLQSITNDFVNVLFFLFPLISRPIRITSHSASLIDNIFTNNISSRCNNGLIINDLSDHLPIFLAHPRCKNLLNSRIMLLCFVVYYVTVIIYVVHVWLTKINK